MCVCSFIRSFARSFVPSFVPCFVRWRTKGWHSAPILSCVRWGSTPRREGLLIHSSPLPHPYLTSKLKVCASHLLKLRGMNGRRRGWRWCGEVVCGRGGGRSKNKARKMLGTSRRRLFWLPLASLTIRATNSRSRSPRHTALDDQPSVGPIGLDRCLGLRHIGCRLSTGHVCAFLTFVYVTF